MSDPHPLFVDVEVEAGPAHGEGISLRFKRASEERLVRELDYESEDGLSGRWRIFATSDVEGRERSEARAMKVEDSSDGLAWLIVGGVHGLLLEHVETGTIAREPYLLLSKATVIP